MIKLKKLDIEHATVENLPIFYHQIVYNDLIQGGAFKPVVFSERLQSYVRYGSPPKLVSKIIDYTKVG